MTSSPLAAEMMSAFQAGLQQGTPSQPNVAASVGGLQHNDLDTQMEPNVGGTGLPNPGYVSPGSATEIPSAPTVMDQPSLDQLAMSNPAQMAQVAAAANANYGRPMPAAPAAPAAPNGNWQPQAQQQQHQLHQAPKESLPTQQLSELRPRQAPIKTTSSKGGNKGLIIGLSLGIILIAAGVAVYLFVL